MPAVYIDQIGFLRDRTAAQQSQKWRDTDATGDSDFCGDDSRYSKNSIRTLQTGSNTGVK